MKPPVWRLLLLFVASIGLLLGWHFWRGQGDGLLHVSFLDVGQGDAAVIETPSGKVIMIDTGGAGMDGSGDGGSQVVAPFLRQRGIERINDLILTHPHADHIGGAASLLRRFDVETLLDNGQPTASSVVTQYLEAASARHVPVHSARRGQRLDCGDGVTLDILAPTPDEAAQSADTNGGANNASVVARLRYGRTVFLFMGDAEADEEAELTRSGLALDCDVLKAGHHGSRTSTTLPFLQAAHPASVVISVGAHNLYGHPGREVIARLQAGHMRIFRTDQSGAVLCASDGVAVRAGVMRPTAP